MRRTFPLPAVRWQLTKATVVPSQRSTIATAPLLPSVFPNEYAQLACKLTRLAKPLRTNTPRDVYFGFVMDWSTPLG